MSQSQLMTNDFKATRFPQAVVKQNAVPDREELVRRSGPQSGNVLYPMPNLGGDLTDAPLLLHENDLAFRVIGEGWGEEAHEERTMMNQSIAVKCVSIVNGMAGDAEAIENIIELLGPVEQGNGDSRTNVANVLRGGAGDLLYNSPFGCRMNGLLQAYVPTPDMVDKMMTDKPTHALGRKGCVPLAMREYDPKKLKYLSPAGMLWWFKQDMANKMPMKSAVEQLPKIMAQFYRFAAPVGAAAKDEVAFRIEIIQALENYVIRGNANVDFLNMLHECVVFMCEAKIQRERLIFGRAQQPATNGKYFPYHHLHYSF